MFISLQQLERKPVQFSLNIDPGQLELDGKSIQTSTLQADGRALLLNHSLGEIRIEGTLKVTVSSPCDRCLEPTDTPIEKAFDLVYLPADETSRGEEEVEEGATDVGYYEGAGLELNDILREVVLLALPMQVVCREECRGICSMCGQNRNLNDCGCHYNATDDRWSGLKNFRPHTA